MVETSSLEKVRELYESSAESYAAMMDTEIELPIYSEILSRMALDIAHITGPVVDTSCGSGHMLARYHERHDPTRPLVGVDLSPGMVAISHARLGSRARVLTGDMCNLESLEPNSSAAVISFFAIHHLDPEKVPVALQHWYRILQPGGRLVLAAWEGAGPIDYGDFSEVVALKHPEVQIKNWVETAGFVLNRCVVEFIAEMSMNALYLEANKT